jgi:transcriptional regulator with XRE-family HTH domain
VPRIKLDNYLRAYRKRSGLSQDEVAYLLGSHSGTKVSRYERGGRLPNLDTALAYDFIFRAPARVLFAGRQQRVERSILRRVARLQDRLETKGQPSPRKLQALAAIRQLGGGASPLVQ